MRNRKAIHLDFKELDKRPEDLGREDAIKRGKEFEELILELFEAEKLLQKKSYYTTDGRSEQIDGAINIGSIRALLEIKWVSSSLAASELYAFLGKVEGKFIGTIGVFISRNELSSNFLKSLRAGRRQSVIVIHGNDVDDLFDSKFPVRNYLRATINQLSFDNKFHYATADFLRQSQRRGVPTDKINANIRRALENRDYTNIINEWVEDIDTEEATKILKEGLELYLNREESGELGSIQKSNIICLLAEVVPKLPEKRIDADWLFYNELSINFVQSVFLDLIEYFAERYTFLTADEKNKVNKRLTNQWDKHIGVYDYENKLAEVTNSIWSYLDDPTQSYLLKQFLSFIESGRRKRFPQMQLALKVLSETDPEKTEPIVKELLKENIIHWYNDDIGEIEDKSKLARFYTKEYQKWEPYTKSNITSAIQDVIAEIEKENK